MSSKEFIELKQMITEGFKTLKAQAKQVMNLNEAAEYLGVSQRILRGWNERREIPYSKPGGKLIFYKKSDLDNYIEKNKIHSSEQISNKAIAYLSKSK